MGFDIPTKADVEYCVDEMAGEDSWQSKVLDFLHQKSVQYTIVGLLFMDVVILFIEIFLLATFPPCYTIRRDAISCCPSASTDESHSRMLFIQRMLAGGGDICEEKGTEPVEYEAGCDGSKYAAVHTLEEWLFAFTILILSIFMLELLLEMAALTPAVFFRQFFFLLDFVIVFVSLGLELGFHFAGDEQVSTFFGLIVLARIWRFIRIGHGLVTIASDLTHEYYAVILTYIDSLENKLTENGIELPEEDEIIKHVKNALSGSHSGHDGNKNHKMSIVHEGEEGEEEAEEEHN